jgi:hypothetical protein
MPRSSGKYSVLKALCGFQTGADETFSQDDCVRICIGFGMSNREQHVPAKPWKFRT